MPPIKTLTAFTVEGTGLFPFDMLRYDSCWPEHESDSAVIDGTVRRGSSNGAVSVMLLSKNPSPTYERWLSFGWKVVGIPQRRTIA